MLNTFSKYSLVLALSSGVAMATDYTAPPEVAPFAFTNSDDTINIISGTFATPSGNNTAYSLDVSSITSNPPGPPDQHVLIDSGATLSYNGSTSNASALFGNLLLPVNVRLRVRNNGTISRGTGTDAVNLSNGNTNFGADLIFDGAGSIDGNFSSSGFSTTEFYIPGTSTINGNFSISDVIASGGIFFLGTDNTSIIGGTFTTQGTFTTNVTLGLLDSSIMIMNHECQFENIAAGGIPSTVSIIVNAPLSLNGNIDLTGGGPLNLQARSSITLGGDVRDLLGGTFQPLVPITLTAANFGNTNPINTQFAIEPANTNMIAFDVPGVIEIGDLTLTSTDGYLSNGSHIIASSSSTINVNGTTTLPSNTKYLSFDSVTDGGANLLLNVTRVATFDQFADNALNAEIAAALENVGANNPNSEQITLLDALEACPDTACLNHALEQMAPITISNVQSVNNTLLATSTTNSHLGAIRSDFYSAGSGYNIDLDTVWLMPYGEYANQQTTDQITGYNAHTWGFALGNDFVLNNRHIVGFGFAYARSDIKEKSHFGSTPKVDSYQAIIYGSYNTLSSKYIDLIASAAWNSYSGNRLINFSGFNSVQEIDYSNVNLSLEGIYGINLSPTAIFSENIYLSTLYAFGSSADYTFDNGGAAMDVHNDSMNLLRLAVGMDFELSIPVRSCTFKPYVHAKAYTNVVNDSQDSNFNFIGNATQVNYQVTPERNGLIFDFGLNIMTRGHFEMNASFGTNLQYNYKSYAGQLNVKYIL